MSLSSLPLAKDVLGINPSDEDWLQFCLTCVSPFGDVVIVASGKSALIYLKKFDADSKVFYKLSKTYAAEEDIGEISAISYIPVKTEKSGKLQDFWHCLVIGYQSGWVHFVTEDGQLLIAKQFISDSAVVKIRILPAIPPKRTKNPALLVPKLCELLILYNSTIVSIDNSVLLSSLTANKSEKTRILSNLPARKWKIRDQEIVYDVAAFAEINLNFNQLHKVSMNKQLLNEEHLRSLGYVVSYLSAGSSPFLQVNSPHSLLPTAINELAQNMVTTVKSGILKAASGFFWGSNPEQDQEPVKEDPEQKLEMRFNFRDEKKEALAVEVSPDSRYTAIFDVQNRVLLMENSTGILLHIWKGYHHAQFGWLTTTSNSSEFAILLAIYLPRRGLLEIWSPDQKSRIAHFPVSKRGRLLTSVNTVLDLKQSSNLRQFSVGFLNPDGKIGTVSVPIHSLTDKSSVHDANLKLKLKEIFEQEERKIEAEKVIELIRSAKSAMSKLQMTKEVLRNNKTENCKQILDDLQIQVESSQLSKRHCFIMKNAFELFEFLEKFERFASDSVEKSKIKEVMKCSDFDAENLASIFEPQTVLVPEFSRETFMNCFHFLQETDQEILPLRLKFVDLGILSFLQQLSTATQNDFQATFEICLKVNLKPQDLLLMILKSNVDYGFAQEVESVWKLYALCFQLHEQDEEQGNFQILLQLAKNFLLKSDMNPETYFIMFHWKCFLSQDPKMSSYAEDWSQMLHFVKSFVQIKSAAKNMEGNFNYKEVFASGNGKLMEVIASYLAELNLLKCDEDLTKMAALHFPCSFHPDIVSAHLSWEYCHRWNKEKSQLDQLEKSLKCLKQISSLELQNRLIRLLWNVQLQKPVKDAINLTEIPSETRCERELGFSQENLPQFLNFSTQFMTLFQKSASENDQIRLCYDVTCNDVSAQRQLIDVLAKSQPEFDQDSIFNLYFQVVTVATFVWQFGLQVKPLSIFSSQEISLFFQMGQAQDDKSKLNLAAWVMSGQNRGIRNARKRFLELAAQSAVACLIQDGAGNVNKDDYEIWAELVGLLAMHWNMQDKLCDISVAAMYKAGHDSLGEELMSSMTDKENVSRKLLRIAMLRLAKNLALNKNEVRLTPEIEAALKSFGDETDEVAEVELSQTANLLVGLSNNELGDAEQQSIYDWLAVAQTLIRNQL